jgi:hypothetical protein
MLEFKAVPSHILDNLMLASKVLVLSLCAFVTLSGHFPPVYAQRTGIQTIPVLTTEDALQDEKITSMDKHLEATDAEVARQAAITATSVSDISEMRGESRVLFGLLGLLSTVQIVIQVRRKEFVIPRG